MLTNAALWHCEVPKCVSGVCFAAHVFDVASPSIAAGCRAASIGCLCILPHVSLPDNRVAELAIAQVQGQGRLVSHILENAVVLSLHDKALRKAIAGPPHAADGQLEKCGREPQTKPNHTNSPHQSWKKGHQGMTPAASSLPQGKCMAAHQPAPRLCPLQEHGASQEHPDVQRGMIPARWCLQAGMPCCARSSVPPLRCARLFCCCSPLLQLQLPMC